MLAMILMLALIMWAMHKSKFHLYKHASISLSCPTTSKEVENLITVFYFISE